MEEGSHCHGIVLLMYSRRRAESCTSERSVRLVGRAPVAFWSRRGRAALGPRLQEAHGFPQVLRGNNRTHGPFREHHVQVPRIALVSLLVREYDEAIDYFVHTLGFDLVEDTRLDETKRWVVVAPAGDDGTGLLLARADTSAQRERVGDQTAGRVSLFLHTDDFDGDHARMLAAGVTFLEAPRQEAYGKVAVFQDLYGNRWDLIQPQN